MSQHMQRVIFVWVIVLSTVFVIAACFATLGERHFAVNRLMLCSDFHGHHRDAIAIQRDIAVLERSMSWSDAYSTEATLLGCATP